jgi:hypothetical protein
LLPTIELAPSVLSDAPKHHLASDPHRKRQPMQQRSAQIASRPASANADRDFAALSRKQKYP